MHGFMPFGKYKGIPIADLPTEYLAWLIKKEFMRDPLKTQVEEEYNLRTDKKQNKQEQNRNQDWNYRRENFYSNNQRHSSGLGFSFKSDRQREDCRKIISAGYRALSMQYHPDHGGKIEDMQNLNVTVEWLREKLFK